MPEAARCGVRKAVNADQYVPLVEPELLQCFQTVRSHTETSPGLHQRLPQPDRVSCLVVELVGAFAREAQPQYSARHTGYRSPSVAHERKRIGQPEAAEQVVGQGTVMRGAIQQLESSGLIRVRQGMAAVELPEDQWDLRGTPGLLCLSAE